MTKHELLVMSAYTSYLFCEVDKLHKFIEETLGCPVLTHELSEDIDGTAARYPAHCADTADGLYNLKLEVCRRPPEGEEGDVNRG